MPARIVALVSGTGSNLAALLAACTDPAYGAQVVAVGADRAGTGGEQRAAAAGIPTFVVAPADHPDRAAWDRALCDTVRAYHPDLVVSAGFLRVLGPTYLAALGDRTVNTHPALLPAFPGTHAVRDALAYGVTVTGCTLHFVDAGVDTGPVVAQAAVPVRPDDDVATLHERIKAVEHDVLVTWVGRLARDGWSVNDRRVRIP